MFGSELQVLSLQSGVVGKFLGICSILYTCVYMYIYILYITYVHLKATKSIITGVEEHVYESKDVTNLAYS